MDELDLNGNSTRASRYPCDAVSQAYPTCVLHSAIHHDHAQANTWVHKKCTYTHVLIVCISIFGSWRGFHVYYDVWTPTNACAPLLHVEKLILHASMWFIHVQVWTWPHTRAFIVVLTSFMCKKCWLQCNCVQPWLTPCSMWEREQHAQSCKICLHKMYVYKNESIGCIYIFIHQGYSMLLLYTQRVYPHACGWPPSLVIMQQSNAQTRSSNLFRIYAHTYTQHDLISEHMIKHRYVPFSFGKPKFKGKPEAWEPQMFVCFEYGQLLLNMRCMHHCRSYGDVIVAQTNLFLLAKTIHNKALMTHVLDFLVFCLMFYAIAIRQSASGSLSQW
jgi:hypothetical protein